MRSAPLTAAATTAFALAFGSCASEAPATTPTETTALLEQGKAPAVGPVKITWDAELKAGFQMEEKLCWNVPMTRLMPEARAALRYVTSAFDEEGRALSVGENGIDVQGAGCATLTLDLGRAAAEMDDRDNISVDNGTLVTSPDMWLWRPEPWPAATRGALTLRLPEGILASVPFARDTDGTYVVPPSTWKMMCKCAFGKLTTKTVEVGDATFTLSRIPGSLRASDAGLERWLRAAAGAVSMVGNGKFPVRRAQVLLVPVEGGGAIPFGMAIRGGGPAAVILVSSRAKDDELLGEWVGVHELSHLLIPPVNREDAWLSEGLASYYQQILRGRSGLLEQDVAWAALVDGFDRGKDEARDRPLLQSSHHMYDDYGFVPVYWGGAAILFELDVALREKGRSLDELVAGVRVREPEDVTYRAADDVIAWWAEAAPDVDVRGIVQRGLASRFPDVEPQLAALGVRRGRVESIALLDDKAARADIRRAIMTPPPR